MKKLMVLFFAAFMAVSFAGTAMATSATTLSNANTLEFFASPVTETGVSVYLLAGSGLSGASLIAVNPANGTSSVLVPSASGLFRAGSTAFGTPAVISGETVFVQVADSNNTSGTSVAAINGSTGATYYTVNIPQPPNAQLAFNSGAFSGITGYAAPLTIDPAGGFIYGISGVSTASASTLSGVSIWRIRTSNGALTSFSSGVSSVWAAPLISGNSIYILGNNSIGGVSLIAFNKATGVRAARANVLGPTGATPFATPVISGNSIFVIDSTGGLTAYNKNTLVAGGSDFIQYAPAASSAVTASPVTNGSFLVVTANSTANGVAGITVFNLSRSLAGPTGASWFFEWTGATITATPAISNGVVYVAVNKTSQGGEIDRFNLSGHSGRLAAPDFTPITTDSRGRFLGFFDFSSPIIKGTTLDIVSNGGLGVAGFAPAATPILYSFDVNAGGTAAWPQFKFDAERTGNNTAAAAPPAPTPGDEGGCFITTIK